MTNEKPISGLMLLEAAVAGVPATFLLIVYGPWAAIVASSEWQKSTGFAAAVAGLALAGTVALTQYWILAIRTAQGRLHPMGNTYWLSLLSGAVAVAILFVFAWPVGIACVLPGAAAIHFRQIQRHLKTSASHSSVA